MFDDIFHPMFMNLQISVIRSILKSEVFIEVREEGGGGDRDIS